LRTETDTVVVSSLLVPSRTNFNVGGIPPTFQLEGFFREDGELPEVYIEVTDPSGTRTKALRVIGVVEDSAFYSNNIVTAQETLDGLLGQTVPDISYMLRLGEGVDPIQVADQMEAAFLANGMRVEDLASEVREITAANVSLNNLLQGFMALGLVVGIAALGVIAARSVVERRQQIGMLRAIGFQRGMVQMSFLIESSFVALLGIAIGAGLAIALSVSIIAEIASQTAGVRYVVPWGNIILVVAVAYVASLLTTYLPARQAANVYPAEALRSAE
jgi:putative ABC transport system permease protein